MGLLDGRVILITGAGNGIGRAHALACAREGAHVVVNDLGGARDGSGGDDSAAAVVVAEIEAMGGQAVANHDSVTDPAGCARMVSAALDRWGRLDGLVNNAGILRDRSFRKMTADEWSLVVDVHLNGTFNVTKAALPALLDAAATHGRAAIVNTSSISGLIGNFGQANYGAAKGGIYSLTRVLAVELARKGVQVNALAPIAKTRMTDDLERVQDAWGPERVSPVVVYLLSDLARDITGRVFGAQGQRIHAYEVKRNEGVTKPGEQPWTAQEIHEHLDAIFDFADGPGVFEGALPVDPGGEWVPPVGKTYDGGYGMVERVHAHEFAAATGDDSITYFGPDAIAPPMFHMRLLRDMMYAVMLDPDLDLDFLKLVHGEHDATFHKTLKHGDLVQLRARLDKVEQKSRGLLVEATLMGFTDGEIAVEARSSFFVRDQVRLPVPEPGSSARKAPPPLPQPEWTIPWRVDDDQSFRYRDASLDDNPIHTDLDTAKAAGLPDVILHGLCTMTMAGHSLVKHLEYDDARKLRRLSVRFSKPVFNGAQLTTEAWRTERGVEFRVLDDRGAPVISNGLAVFSD